MSWREIRFDEVAIGSEFGFGDYFHTKTSETKAYCHVSGEEHEWAAKLKVVQECKPESLAPGNSLEVFPEVDVVDEDWLAGVSCNPNAPEECESCQ